MKAIQLPHCPHEIMQKTGASSTKIRHTKSIVILFILNHTKLQYCTRSLLKIALASTYPFLNRKAAGCVFRLRVNHHDFMALHSMWVIFLKGLMCLSIKWKLCTCRNSNREQLRKIHQLWVLR